MKVNRLTDFAANTWSGASLAENLAVEHSTTEIQVGMAANGDFLLVFQDECRSVRPVLPALPLVDRDWSGPESAVESRPEDIVSVPSMAMNEAGAAIVSWGQRTGTGGVSAGLGPALERLRLGWDRRSW